MSDQQCPAARAARTDFHGPLERSHRLELAKVPEELHLYNDGAHGTSIRKATGDMAAWPARAAAWLVKMKLVVTQGP